MELKRVGGTGRGRAIGGFLLAVIAGSSTSCDSDPPGEARSCSATTEPMHAEPVGEVVDSVQQINVFETEGEEFKFVLSFPELDLGDGCWWLQVYRGSEDLYVPPELLSDAPLQLDEAATPPRVAVTLPLAYAGTGTELYLSAFLFAPDGRVFEDATIQGAVRRVLGTVEATPSSTCDAWEEPRTMDLVNDDLDSLAEERAELFFGPQGGSMITPRLVVDNPHAREDSCAFLTVTNQNEFGDDIGGGYSGPLLLNETKDGRLATGNIYNEVYGDKGEIITVNVNAVIDGAKIDQSFAVEIK